MLQITLFHRYRNRIVLTLILGAFILLAARMFLYTEHFAVNMMFWDQWAVYKAFFNNVGLVDAFRFQHGPHRQGLGALLIYITAQLTSWDGRADAYLVAGVLVIAAALALLLKYRYTGKLVFVDICIPVLFLSLNQWEQLTVVPNVSHSALPLLLVMVYAIALTLKQARAQAIIMTIANFMLLYTGFGIFAAFITPLLFGYRSVTPESAGFAKSTRWIWMVSLLLSLLALLTFFQDWVFRPAVNCMIFPHPRPFEYVIFMGLQVSQGFGLAPMADQLEPANAMAMVIGICMIFGAIGIAFQSALSRRSVVISFLVAFSLLFVINTALGRVCLGATQQPLSSKYATLVLPMLLGIYLWSSQKSRNWQLAIGISAISMIALAQAPPFYRDPYTGTPQTFHDIKVNWKTCYLASLDPYTCDQVAQYQMFPRTELIIGNLRYLEENRLNLFNDVARDVQINFPPNGSIVTESRIKLTGIINPPQFEHYEVQWGTGEFPSTWQWISGPHKSPVINSQITEWDISQLPGGTFTIRVTVFLNNGSQRVALTRFVK